VGSLGKSCSKRVYRAQKENHCSSAPRVVAVCPCRVACQRVVVVRVASAAMVPTLPRRCQNVERSSGCLQSRYRAALCQNSPTRPRLARHLQQSPIVRRCQTAHSVHAALLVRRSEQGSHRDQRACLLARPRCSSPLRRLKRRYCTEHLHSGSCRPRRRGWLSIAATPVRCPRLRMYCCLPNFGRSRRCQDG